jgi:hypothetical protein
MPQRKIAKKSKSPSTQAGKYVQEEIEHVRQGKHGARSAKQLIAIGLSRARRAAVNVPRAKGKPAPEARVKHKPNPRRSRASSNALKREGKSAASHEALSKQARRRRLSSREFGHRKRSPNRASISRRPR